jgi:hypothetical protein
LIDEIVHAIDTDRLIFEAPRREQQVWMLHHLGADCNLGNIAADDVLSLETLRLGLRSDTVERFAVDGSRQGSEDGSRPESEDRSRPETEDRSRPGAEHRPPPGTESRQDRVGD